MTAELVALPVEMDEVPDKVKFYGAPFLICGYFGKPGENRPETFPLMNLDPAIDAARAIYHDGSYYRIVVRDNYTGAVIAQFDRYRSPDDTIIHQHEAIGERKKSDKE